MSTRQQAAILSVLKRRRESVRREALPYGYRTYTGVVPCDAHVDTYNALQVAINVWIDAGRDAPGWLLDHSHRHFVMMSRG